MTARVGPRVFDRAVVGLLLAVALVDTWSLASAGDLRGPVWLAGAVQVWTVLLLLVRRQRPFAVAVLSVAVTVGWWLLEGDPPIASAVTLSAAVTAYSLGRFESDRRRAGLGLLVIAVGLSMHLALDSRVNGWGDVAAELPWDLLVLGTWVAGALVRYRHLYAESLRAAGAREERHRITRELHDVVVHGLSVMVVQAEAAGALLETGRTDRARQALGEITSVGRASLEDLRASIANLSGVPLAEGAAGSGLAAVDDLAERVRGAGLRIDVRRVGPARPVSPAVSLAAYRVVQECLTNILRHSTARHANVELAFVDERLRVTVADHGPPLTPHVMGNGVGLSGLTERVRALGGELRSGQSGTGFAVTADVPLATP
jgi:signal transduction histidine kinase